MNPQYFLEYTQLLLRRQNRIESLEAADCLDALAQCIRIIGETDPTLGQIMWTAVQLCRGSSSKRIALMLEKFARDIRLEARKNNRKSIVGTRR